MSNIEKTPNLEKIQERAKKMQKNCHRWDALISVTEDLITQLEEEIRQQPNYIYRLEKAKNSLNFTE
ncbi:hypothetical protein [Geminocystis herdmanii]|uniref:hypothetical protein n=1 Tax=Geminocystis herdmanii TaxID=669359 RepID=UPI00034C3B2F|nr:hypothetical protein [Geminocystis herdmanii]